MRESVRKNQGPKEATGKGPIPSLSVQMAAAAGEMAGRIEFRAAGRPCICCRKVGRRKPRRWVRRSHGRAEFSVEKEKYFTPEADFRQSRRRYGRLRRSGRSMWRHAVFLLNLVGAGASIPLPRLLICLLKKRPRPADFSLHENRFKAGAATR